MNEEQKPQLPTPKLPPPDIINEGVGGITAVVPGLVIAMSVIAFFVAKLLGLL